MEMEVMMTLRLYPCSSTSNWQPLSSDLSLQLANWLHLNIRESGGWEKGLDYIYTPELHQASPDNNDDDDDDDDNSDNDDNNDDDEDTSPPF